MEFYWLEWNKRHTNLPVMEWPCQDSSDNGIGFNAVENESKKTLGLLGMKERTLIMGGTYEITSKPGNGTTVVISVPVNN